MRRLSLQSIADSSLPVPGHEPWFVHPDDPATSAMTDFRDRPSVALHEGLTVDLAVQHMKHAAVRSAFVTDSANRAVGLITAYDLLGERPLLHMLHAGSKREEVVVRDLMTPIAAWQVLWMNDIEGSTVADVRDLLSGVELTHVPVLERDAAGKTSVRGLFSAAKLTRILRMKARSNLIVADTRLSA